MVYWSVVLCSIDLQLILVCGAEKKKLGASVQGSWYPILTKRDVGWNINNLFGGMSLRHWNCIFGICQCFRNRRHGGLGPWLLFVSAKVLLRGTQIFSLIEVPRHVELQIVLSSLMESLHNFWFWKVQHHFVFIKPHCVSMKW